MSWASLTAEGTMAFHEGVPTLQQLQAAVRGNVEAIEFELAGAAATLWCDDEGKLVDQPHRNFKAEFICPLPNDWIAGDTALTGGPDEDGVTLGLTEAQARELHRIKRDVHAIVFDRDAGTVRLIG